MLDYRPIFERAVERVQKQAEKDRHWLIDMVPVVRHAVAALLQVDAFDAAHGDSIDVSPAPWHRCVTIRLRELLSFYDVGPLLRALEHRGFRQRDGSPRDDVSQGRRSYSLYNDRYQSIDLDAYLATDQVPECEIIEVTEVRVKQEYLCKELT